MEGEGRMGGGRTAGSTVSAADCSGAVFGSLPSNWAQVGPPMPQEGLSGLQSVPELNAWGVGG